MGTKDILNAIGMGERMRKYRITASKTQHQVADEVGIAMTSYANYENGYRVPKYSVLEKIAKALNVTVYDLLADTDTISNAVAQILKSNPDVSDAVSAISTSDSIKAALWGGDKDLSQEDIDALWDDVRDYAAFKAQQRKKSKLPPQDTTKDGE